MAIHLSAYEFDSGIPIECPECGWSGTAAEASSEYFDALFDVSCPKCDKMLLIVRDATIEETKAAAAAGNARAIEEMEYVGRVEDFRARFEREALHEAVQLPEVEGDQLKFVWDFTAGKGETNARTLISLDGRVIWNEPAIWEGHDRFREVKALLKERYGQRFASLTPTRKSETWLMGDKADMTDIPSNVFADPPDEIARLRGESDRVFFLRATPDGDLSLEREDMRASHHEQDGTWLLPAKSQDRLLNALGLEPPGPRDLLECVSRRLRALTGEQMQECFERSGARRATEALLRVELFSGDIAPGTTSHSTASIDKQGDLLIEVQDVGQGPSEFFGDSDYEWWITVRRSKKRLVLELLRGNNPVVRADVFDQDGALLSRIKLSFGGKPDAPVALRRWLDEKGIPYEFFSHA